MGFFEDLGRAMGQTADAAADPSAAVRARGAIEEQAREHAYLRATGTPGTAVVLGHEDTGERAAGKPVWLLDLEVTPDGGTPYRVRRREIVSAVAAPAYVAGTTAACRIDPADPQRVAFG